MRRMVKAGIVLFIILTLIVSVQAGSVTSRGSGIGSHDAGGSGYATMSTAAGNSAHVEREVCKTLDKEASPPDTTVVWSDTATDDVGSVTAAGTLKVSREITGGDDGMVKVCARIWADLDETDDPIFEESLVWVDTGMESTVSVDAGAGVTAKGSASVTGYATGSGNWAFDGVSGDVASTSSGKVSVTGEATNAEGFAQSIITGLAQTYCDGYTEFIDAASSETGLDGQPSVYGGLLTQAEGKGDELRMSAEASGSAVMSARGMSEDYSFTSSGSAVGRSSGEFEVDSEEGGGWGAFMSGLGIYFSDSIPGIYPESVLNGLNPMLGAGGILETWTDDSEGSIEAAAKGIAILRESASNLEESYGYDAFGSVEGAAEIEAEQRGNGESAEKAFMEAVPVAPFDDYVYHDIWYPRLATPSGIKEKYIGIAFDESADATSYIEAQSWMESSCEGLDGSSSSSVSGTAYTVFGGWNAETTDLADGSMFIGSMTTRANGMASQELSVDEYGFAEAWSIIDSIASLGPDEPDESGGIEVWWSEYCNPININWDTFSGAGAMVYTGDYTDGSASSESAVSGSATSGATGDWFSGAMDGDSSALQMSSYYSFASTASAAGKVEGEAETTDAEAYTASVILGITAAGTHLDGYRCCDEFETGPFIFSKHGLLSASAVVDDGVRTGIAEGSATGSSSAGGTLTIEELEPEDDFQAQQLGKKYEMISATRGSGTLTSRMSVKNEGLGRSESMLEGGNIVTVMCGLDTLPGYVTSLGLDDWDSSIDTYSGGLGFSDSSQVKGSAAITKAVSAESAHFGYFIYDEDDEEWDLDYALDTKTVMTDPSKAEIKIKGADFATAATFAYGGSEADRNTYGESHAGFGAAVCRSDEKDTAKASIRNLNIYTESKLDGPSTYARVDKCFATATLSSSSRSIGPDPDSLVKAGGTGFVSTDFDTYLSDPGDLHNQYAETWGYAEVIT